MNAQESRILQEFLNQLVQVRGVAKDPQADALIAQAVAQQPDAAYLLAQRALLQEQALNAAKEQIAALQNQLQAQQSTGSGSFLDPAHAWGNHPADLSRSVSPAVMPSAPQNQPPMQSAATASPAPYARQGLPGGAGSFLGNVAATAAGVAGGAFLFHGIENLLGHHGAGGFPGQQGLANMPAQNAAAGKAHEDDAALSNSDLAGEAGIDDIGSADDFSDDFDSGDDGSLLG
jgi:hypothetical protein